MMSYQRKVDGKKDASVELPRNLVEKAGFSKGEALDIVIENGEIVLKRKAEQKD
ncbi:hypothetical protein [Salimicrobium halophilum]|uniref:Looped-hinge helix DNA binding domain-containing protein, AbrB family n=1 Tax=Salimicrobium halophilum TaxID=86666 RepID=A0A1G8QZM5_9BACI|nr:hypothetical protein [Salimicrobium halophilum]SDJ10179.1 hypothetical protein SAMN04490247_0728 [Salimicrobium halophilum]